MPIYEFKCICGEEKEVLVPMGTETMICGACGKTMRKVISNSSFILKGAGWAFDSYGLKPKKKTNNN